MIAAAIFITLTPPQQAFVNRVAFSYCLGGSFYSASSCGFRKPLSKLELSSVVLSHQVRQVDVSIHALLLTG